MLRSRVPFFSVALLPLFLFLFFRSNGNGGNQSPVMKSEVTLVTAWYPDPFQSPDSDGTTFYTERHNNTIYLDGIKTFLSQVTTPIVIFCPPHVTPRLIELRPAWLPLKIITDFESVWDFKPIEPLHKFLDTDEKVTDEGSSDSQPHTPHQYAVWNAKPTMLNEVASRNPYQSSYFFWHDIGAMRATGEKFKHWPDAKRVRAVMNRKSHIDTILLNVMSKQPCYIDGESLARQPPEISFTISATFFGGTKAAVNWFNDAFYDLLNFYVSKGIFTGREERIFHAVAYLAPKKVTAIPGWIAKAPGDLCGMHGWFYRNFLARRDEMWNTQRLIPSAPLFEDVPFENICAADKTKFEKLQDLLESGRVYLVNFWSEALYVAKAQLQEVMKIFFAAV